MANEANKGSQRAYTSPYKKRVNVYPTSGTSYAAVQSFDPTTVRGPMDRIERQAEMFGTGLASGKQEWYGGLSPEERASYFQQNPTITDLSTVKIDPTGGLGTMGGGSGGGGMSSSDKLAWAKWRAEQAQNRSDAETKQRALGLLQNQLAGGYRGNIDALLGQIDEMGKTASGDIGSAYKNALANIGGGYKTATDLTTSGYNALDAFLNKYNSNPYAGLQAQAQTQVPDSMNYLQAYGAPTADVQGQIQAEQLAGQQGADAFNRLMSVLGGAQEQSNLSRLAESQMARNLGLNQLGSQRAAYEAQAANSQAQALAELKQRIAMQRFEQEQAAGSAKQNIIDQLIAAGVNPYPAAAPAAPAQTGLSQDMLSQLAARASRY